MRIFKYICLIIFFSFQIGFTTLAQEKSGEESNKEVSEEIQDRMEEMALINEEETTEDESYLQDLDYFGRHPINLNTADRGTLERLNILNPLQMDNFISYRNLLGKFYSIYEIQAIPGWDIITIRRLLPFVRVSSPELLPSFIHRFRGGEHLLLARHTRVIEKSEGYLRDGNSGRSYYPGSPDKLLIRYRYQFKNQLQFGITTEKDAGEQFFSGHQKYGFDFYSLHFFARDIGIFKAVALGDYSINFGQGLTQWQSLSFAGPGDALIIKRQGEKLRPYVSAGEAIFNRGAGIVLAKNNWEGTFFLSFRNLDATIEKDTIDFATSLRVSGYHRTQSEIDGAAGLGQWSYGANLQYSGSDFRIGMNMVQIYLNKNLLRGNELYKKFISPGDHLANYSVDYSYSYKNFHFFGEAAMDNKREPAFIHGIAVSTGKFADIGLLHRKISKNYVTLYGSAFTQSSTPVNENGLYTGINIRPNEKIKVDAYADVFSFPWLKYRVDAPSSGAEYMVQLHYRPSRENEFYVRYRSVNKSINVVDPDYPLATVINRVRQTLRMHFNLRINEVFRFRSRIENVWYEQKSGFMIYTDALFKPKLRKVSGNVRLQYFETDDYDTRLYAFENDVLYSYSIPMIYGKGVRYYLNLRYNVLRNLSLWARIAQTNYLDRNEIGSGLDKIESNKKTELKTELVWRF